MVFWESLSAYRELGCESSLFWEDPRYLQEFIAYCKTNKPELNFQSCYHYWDEKEALSASMNSIYKFLPHVILLDFSENQIKLSWRWVPS